MFLHKPLDSTPTAERSPIQCSRRPDPAKIPSIDAIYDKQWYSGYLDVNSSNTHMHYFYFPSQSNPSSDPLLFWFNGGPGCSSLLGALYENGPFIIIDSLGIMAKNPYGWNQKANMVFIQSPATVGFSYMDRDPNTWVWNDDIVAQLNLMAVIQFHKVWPEFKNRPLYIAGESYAGIYVPTLAEKIHQWNTSPDPELIINMKGFAVGNGCTSPNECEFLSDYPHYQYKLFRDFGIITDELFQQADLRCKNIVGGLPQQCLQVMDRIDTLADGINIYDLYRACYENNNGDQLTVGIKEQRRRLWKRGSRGTHQSVIHKYGDQKNTTNPLNWAPPCVDSYGIDQLLQDPSNRRTLNIPDNVPAYSMCNNADSFHYQRSMTGSYGVYKKLVPLNKYRITIYSGDSDPAVPYSGSNEWINQLRGELGLGTMQFWRPWYTTTRDGIQNSGNVWTLSNGFKFVTFKGIGHMAPQWNPEGGFKMISDLMGQKSL